jgi:DNA-binding IclR family transcriptional regulator
MLKPDEKEAREAGGPSMPLSRAAHIIDAVAGLREGVTLKKISDAVGLPASTTHRLVNSLLAIGYLAMDEQDKTYHLGRRLVRVMHVAFGARNVQALADPTLSRLLRQFGQVFYVNQLVVDKVRLVAFALPEVAERALIVPGEYSPIHATASGKAIFAFQDEAIIARQLAAPLRKFLPNTLTDPTAIRDELTRVREQGYAITHSEFEMGVTAMAVPIDIPYAGVVFSIGVTGLEQQIFERYPIETYVDELRSAAVELRASLSSMVAVK